MNRENFEKLLQANREAPAEVFNMGAFFGTPTACGTPACLLGNYALRPDLQSAFVKREQPRGAELIGETATGRIVGLDGEVVCEHFGITSNQAERLFGADGCNNARTNRDKALAYVEHFMATGETPHDCDGFDEDEDCEDEDCDCDGSGGYDEGEKDIIDEGFDADALVVDHTLDTEDDE